MQRILPSVGRCATPPSAHRSPTISTPLLCVRPTPIFIAEESTPHESQENLTDFEDPISTPTSDDPAVKNAPGTTKNPGIDQSPVANPRRVSTGSSEAENANELSEDIEITNASEILKEIANDIQATTLHKTLKISPRYTLLQKRKIVWEAFHKKKNIRPTARKYKISHGSIHHWKALFDRANNISESRENIRLAQLSSKGIVGRYYTEFYDDSETFGVYGSNEATKLTSHGGRPRQIPDWAQVHLSHYFDHMRQTNQRVTVNNLCTEYLTICPEETEHLSFSAVRQRIYRWAKKDGIVDRAITHQAQCGDYCSERVNDWVSFIRQQIEVYDIKPENIANFDETNVDFTLEAKRTLNRKGAKTVQTASASLSSRATVMLGATMTGHKFPPFVIFKGKRGGRIEKKEMASPQTHGYPSGMFYSVQGNAWMDEVGMHLWIDNVWVPFTNKKQTSELFLLILDEFRGHMVSSVMYRLGELRTLVEIIPGGYTGKLQVMDVGVNRPFKAIYNEEHFSFLRLCNETNLPGTRAIPTRQDVSKWIDVAWKAVKKDSIVKTWCHIGLCDPIIKPISVLDEIEETRIQLGAESMQQQQS